MVLRQGLRLQRGEGAQARERREGLLGLRQQRGQDENADCWLHAEASQRTWAEHSAGHLAARLRGHLAAWALGCKAVG